MSAEVSPAPRQKLAEAIENLYATFSEFRLGGPMDGHPPLPPAKEERLQTIPLRHLTPDDLDQYAFRALTTVGTEEQFKHFLPRLLEITAYEGSVGYVDIQIVLGKLEYAHWTFWSVQERQAIERYLWALWESVLAQFPSEPDIEALLCGIGRVVDDLTPFLNVWLRGAESSAISHLHGFIEANLRGLLKKHRITNAFCDEREPQMMQVVNWLAQPALTERLEQMFFEYSQEPIAEQLSQLVEYLTLVRLALSPGA
jgi:hypothetical protein